MFLDHDLWPVVEDLLDAAWKPSTKRSYASAQRKYISFCHLYNVDILPATENVLLQFIAFLHTNSIKGQSIRCYMSAVRQFHIINGYPEPQKTPLLAASIKGAMVYSSPPSRKAPITTDILTRLVTVCQSRSDLLLMKTVMCTLFFGCLRAGELCVADQDHFSKSTNVCVKDISFHGSEYFELFLRKSKTDRFSMGVTVVVGCSGAEPCAFVI